MNGNGVPVTGKRCMFIPTLIPYMDDEIYRHARPEQYLKIGGHSSRSWYPPYYYSIQSEKNDDPTNPILRKKLQNEVCLILRQELQPRLCPVTDALTPQTSGSDSDSRLICVIPCSMDIWERIDEVLDTIFLILFETKFPSMTNTRMAMAIIARRCFLDMPETMSYRATPRRW